MGREEFLWVEKYRPKTVDDCVVPQSIKKYFTGVIAQGDFQHLLLHSASPGTGKTTLAKALCNEMGLDYIVINGSDEGRLLETVRNKIRQFASTGSLMGGNKVVIVDEADGIPADTVQKSLRSFIEEFSANCRFIFTANYPWKLIDPIRSRLTMIEFSIPKDEKPAILKEFFQRCCMILEKEGVGYNKRYLAEFIAKNFPDFRKTLNEMQKYASYNEEGVDEGILHMLSAEMGAYLKALKDKDFAGARKWLAETSPESNFYSELLNELYNKLDGSSIAQIILTVGEYAYRHPFVADPQVNLAAMTVEIMANATWK